MKKILLIGLCLFAVSCKKVELKDGIVPDAYLKYAQKLVGVYQGDMNGVPTVFEIYMNGAKPQVRFENKIHDLLAVECQSSVGKLNWVKANDDMQITDFAFEFNPNLCKSIQGRELEFDVTEENGQIKLFGGVFHRVEYRDEPNCPYLSPQSGNPLCDKEPVGVWILGNFKK